MLKADGPRFRGAPRSDEPSLGHSGHGPTGGLVDLRDPQRITGALLRRTLLNFGWLSSGNAFALGLAFVTSAVLARRLGRAGFGSFCYAQAIAAYLVLLVDLGLNSFGCRAVAREPEKSGQFLGAIAGTQLATAIVVVLAVALASQIFNLWPQGELAPPSLGIGALDRSIRPERGVASPRAPAHGCRWRSENGPTDV